jgi:hypothetical protein
MPRLSVIVLLIAVLAAAGWSLFSWEKKNKAVARDLWDAVPAQSAVIISVPDAWNTWDRFTHTSQLWEAFEQLPSFAAAGHIMSGTVERMQNDAALREALEDAPVLIALLRSGGNAVEGLFIGCPGLMGGTPLRSYAELMGLDEAARNALSRGDVIQIRPDTTLPALSISLQEDLWLMATTPQVMDEALFQLRSGRSILQDSLMVRMKGTMGGGTDANMLVHLRRTAGMLGSSIGSEVASEIRLPDGWVAMDMRSRPDAMLLSGLLMTVDRDPAMISLHAQGTGRPGVTRVLPAAVSAIDAMHISDPRLFMEGRLVNEQDPELVPAMFHWVQGSVGRAWASEHSQTWRWAFFQAGDPEEAQRALRSLCTGELPCEQQEYRNIILHHASVNNALERLLGEAWSEFGRPWWSILGDVVLFSNSPAALKTSVDAWHDGNSLAEDPRFTSWAQKISTNSGRFIWCDVARAGGLLRDQMRPHAQEEWDLAAAFRSRIGGFSIQLSPGQRGYTHVVAGLQHAPLEQQDNDLLWEAEIGALVEQRPSIVRNHNNNTNEVLVQDVEHKIHLIGSTGKILWTRQLDGPIMGQVHQVDKFRNGKLQLLFNTAGKVHLIDRNGKDVGDFPLALRDKAVAPLAVFDYENEQDYRIVVPVEKGRILNLGIDGREVNGWERPVLKADAASMVHHIRIKNKDHLILADRNGAVYILDRRGLPRERTALDLGTDPQVEHILPGNEIMNSSIIWRNAEGLVQQAWLNGAVAMLSPEGAGGTQRTLDMDGDGSMELFRVHGDSLIVSRDGKPVYTRVCGSPIHETPDVHVLDPRRRAISVSGGNGKVRLLDDSGRDLPGSPLAGDTPPAVADLNLDEIPELITVTGNGRVVAYSLNRLGRAN